MSLRSILAAIFTMDDGRSSTKTWPTTYVEPAEDTPPMKSKLDLLTEERDRLYQAWVDYAAASNDFIQLPPEEGEHYRIRQLRPDSPWVDRSSWDRDRPLVVTTEGYLIEVLTKADAEVPPTKARVEASMYNYGRVWPEESIVECHIKALKNGPQPARLRWTKLLRDGNPYKTRPQAVTSLKEYTKPSNRGETFYDAAGEPVEHDPAVCPKRGPEPLVQIDMRWY